MKLYHLYNEIFEITHCEFFEEGKQPENAIYIENCNFIKPMVNSTTKEVYEGATPEEIAEKEELEAIAIAEAFMAEKEADGKAYYKSIDLRITVALSTVDRDVLFPILQEVDDLLYPPLNKIKTGDFASALYLFSNQQPPTNQFVLDFYNEAVAFCQNYYDTQYPK